MINILGLKMLLDRRTHKPQVVGSSPTLATKRGWITVIQPLSFLFFYIFYQSN